MTAKLTYTHPTLGATTTTVADYKTLPNGTLVATADDGLQMLLPAAGEWVVTDDGYEDSDRERQPCYQRYEWCPGPDAPNEDGAAWGGKCAGCFLDSHEDIDRLLSGPIMDVWGGYDDFDTFDYVAFVIEENARELRDAENFAQAKRELADTAVCALRMLAEMGYHPEASVLERLSDRMDGEQNQIIETYKRRYRDTDS